MNVIGIDPGRSGAIVVLDAQGNLPPQAYKLDATEQDVAGVLRACGGGLSHAFIERVHAMPAQGVASSFKFGQSYGFLRGLLTGFEIPFEEVAPQKWQRELGCLSKGDKNVTKQKAGQLFPNVKWTHATADAVLIAEYGRRVLKQRMF